MARSQRVCEAIDLYQSVEAIRAMTLVYRETIDGLKGILSAIHTLLQSLQTSDLINATKLEDAVVVRRLKALDEHYRLVWTQLSNESKSLFLTQVGERFLKLFALRFTGDIATPIPSVSAVSSASSTVIHANFDTPGSSKDINFTFNNDIPMEYMAGDATTCANRDDRSSCDGTNTNFDLHRDNTHRNDETSNPEDFVSNTIRLSQDEQIHEISSNDQLSAVVNDTIEGDIARPSFERRKRTKEDNDKVSVNTNAAVRTANQKRIERLREAKNLAFGSSRQRFH